MITGILYSIGGVGLFLLGMHLMTGALRQLGGAALRGMLMRFTRSPTSGAVTGAVSTAIVQSSSATTVAAVGFVSAGLMSFEQAVGIIIGANVGTTITGWLAALLGFKLKLGTAVMPLLLVGVLLNMFQRGRIRSIGMALCGFSLIFVGLNNLQSGMAGLEGVLTPQNLPPNTFGGHLLLALLGVAITVVTQSSSSGVAAALAAIHAGAISLPQAAAMVIGMDVGTTATAMLAAIGGNIDARRTGFAHVFYNVLTGIAAFALLEPLTLGKGLLSGPVSEPEFALVAFHTAYNLTGAVLTLPFAGHFARMVVRIFPDDADNLTSPPDKALLVDSVAASHALHAKIGHIADRALSQLGSQISAQPPTAPNWPALQVACDAQQRYAEQIALGPNTVAGRKRAALHALDHLTRLCRRAQDVTTAPVLHSDAQLRELSKRAAALLQSATPMAATANDALQRLCNELDRQEEAYRTEVIASASQGPGSTERAVCQLEAYRWLRRVLYHAHRADVHLTEA